MGTAVVWLAKGLVFGVLIVSTLVTTYAVIDAISVYTNYDVFFSGLAGVALAILCGVLFSVVGGSGMVAYWGWPTGQAALVAAPTAILWLILVGRLVLQWLDPGPAGRVN